MQYYKWLNSQRNVILFLLLVYKKKKTWWIKENKIFNLFISVKSDLAQQKWTLNGNIEIEFYMYIRDVNFKCAHNIMVINVMFNVWFFFFNYQRAGVSFLLFFGYCVTISYLFLICTELYYLGLLFGRESSAFISPIIIKSDCTSWVNKMQPMSVLDFEWS